MTIKAVLDIDVAEAPLTTIQLDIKRAKVAAMKWYIKNLLETHFKQGAEIKYGYPPLSEKYKKWKSKYFPGKAMLNLHGKLRKAVMQANVNPRTGEIEIPNLPDYAEHVLAFRDFLSPNESDMVLINIEFRKELARIRRGRISTRFK